MSILFVKVCLVIILLLLGCSPYFPMWLIWIEGKKSMFDGVEKSIFEVKLEFGSHVIYVFSSIVIGGASFPLVDLLDHKF